MLPNLGNLGYFSLVAAYQSIQQLVYNPLRLFYDPKYQDGGDSCDIPYAAYLPQSTENSDVIDSFPPIEGYKPPKHPIVLCHGFSGFDKLILIPSIGKLLGLLQLSVLNQNSDHFLDDLKEDTSILALDYWIGVQEFLQSKGCTVITAKVPSFGSIEERAAVLDKFISSGVSALQNAPNNYEVDEAGKVKINLIAHSMGGLDCRYLISKIPDKSYKVMSLTTIATPHHGSEMADYVVEKFNKFKENTRLTNLHLFLPPAFYQLTTYHMKYFNCLVLNSPDVSYFSYGSYFCPKWYNVFYPSWNIIFNRSNGDSNDGLVTTKSSRWGEYMGALCNIDHLDIINWRNKLQIEALVKPTLYNKETAESRNPLQLDILDFYLAISNTLANRGL